MKFYFFSSFNRFSITIFYSDIIFQSNFKVNNGIDMLCTLYEDCIYVIIIIVEFGIMFRIRDFL